tara:strand:- start:6864 stop:7148 length:285 start_codon:yes stop_codon:yes gene_type:complete
MRRYKIPQYAKLKASEAITWNKSVSKSRRVGTIVGRRRATQLLKNEYIDFDTAKRIVAFYKRFRGCKTERCEQAINLWGGRRFGRELSKKIMLK